MRAMCVLFLTLAAALTARADFSYTQTTKSAGGMMGAAVPTVTKTYLKGQKMKIDNGDSIMIMDFDAQTMTHVSTAQKTYTVSKFSELGETVSKSGMDINIDLKETGQRKTINGFNATEMVMTMEMDNPQARQ